MILTSTRASGVALRAAPLVRLAYRGFELEFDFDSHEWSCSELEVFYA